MTAPQASSHADRILAALADESDPHGPAPRWVDTGGGVYGIEVADTDGRTVTVGPFDESGRPLWVRPITEGGSLVQVALTTPDGRDAPGPVIGARHAHLIAREALAILGA